VNVVAELTIQDLGATSDRVPSYASALREACKVVNPFFSTARYGDIYRAVSVDATWVAASLISSAEREADGATRLWSLAACTSNEVAAAQIKQHAVDESRHSRWYVHALDLAFPGAVDGSARRHVDGISPRYSSKMSTQAVPGSAFAHEVTVDDLVQMNLAEIRTSINQRLQLPILLAHCAPERRPNLTTLLNRLLRDEKKHVRYSAVLMEELSRDVPKNLTELMVQRMRDLNAITCEEVDRGEFALHCSSGMCALQGSCVPGAGSSSARETTW